MQIPAEYGEDYIVLAVSVGLATIGVCVFGAVYFGSRTFLYADRGIYEQEYSKKGNRYYRYRTYTRRAYRLSWQRRTRL